MDVTRLEIDGAYVFTPAVHDDPRGSFLEWFRADVFEETTGHPFWLAQANASVSAAGTIRGIHFAELPPSQAKYVTCSHGAVLDVVVDIRVGSPSFGQWAAVELNSENRRTVYISEGLGHAFMSLEDGSVVTYLCSAPYAPGREHGINPLDPAIGIDWPTAGRDGNPLDPLLSAKDADAPSLAAVRESGVLASFEETVRWVDQLRTEAPRDQ